MKKYLVVMFGVAMCPALWMNVSVFAKGTSENNPKNCVGAACIMMFDHYNSVGTANVKAANYLCGYNSVLGGTCGGKASEKGEE